MTTDGWLAGQRSILAIMELLHAENYTITSSLVSNAVFFFKKCKAVERQHFVIRYGQTIFWIESNIIGYVNYSH